MKAYINIVFRIMCVCVCVCVYSGCTDWECMDGIIMYVHSELVCEMRAVEHCSCFHSWLSSIGSCIAAIMVNQWYNNSRACNMYVWAEVNVTNRLDSYTIACEIHRSSVFATR